MQSCDAKKTKYRGPTIVANEDVTPPIILQNAETENQRNLAKKNMKEYLAKNKASWLMHIQSQKPKNQAIKHTRNCAQYI